MNKYYFFVMLFISLGATQLKAQTYVDKVSKDSVATLNSQLEVLKANQKLVELKLKEAKAEDDIESLRIKIKAANEKASKSANASTKYSGDLDNSKVNAKQAQKLAKQAKTDMQSAEKLSNQLNKDVTKLEKLRIDIDKEINKLNMIRPSVYYIY